MVWNKTAGKENFIKSLFFSCKQLCSLSVSSEEREVTHMILLTASNIYLLTFTVQVTPREILQHGSLFGLCEHSLNGI